MGTWEQIALAEVASAARAQDWRHVLELCERERSRRGSLDAELRALEADALRGVGDLATAEEIYSELIATPSGPVAQCLHGLAAIALERGDASRASELSEDALLAAGGDLALSLRIQALRARIISRTDLEGAAELIAGELARPLPAGSARAHARAVHGEILIAAGHYNRARREIRIAAAEARAHDAVRTLADTMRREVSIAVMTGASGALIESLTQLTHAERLLTGLGDATLIRARLQRAEAERHLGSVSLATKTFRSVIWDADPASDDLSRAHALLGLADTLRVAGAPEPGIAADAADIYQRRGCTWGVIHANALVGNMDAHSLAQARAAADANPGAVPAAIDELLDGVLATGTARPLRLAYPDV